MEIVLNNSINPDRQAALEPQRHYNDQREAVLSFCKSGKTVRTELDGEVHHENYLNYLLACWRSHHAAVVDPVLLWHMVISELSIIVKGDPEKYRKYFTDSDKKKNVVIVNGDPEVMNVTAMTDQLKDLVQMDIDMFLPSFSTEMPSTKFAHSAVFCDAASPFYNYMMCLCDIPKIDVKGTKEDWDVFANNLHRLKELFTSDEQTKWLNAVIDIVSNIYGNGDVDFWKDMFSVYNCGSGGEIEIRGWINKFFSPIKTKGGYERKMYGEFKWNVPDMPHNYNSHIAEVKYKQTDTDMNYVLYSGLFNSKFKGDYLRPGYGYVVNELSKDSEESKTMEKDIKEAGETIMPEIVIIKENVEVPTRKFKG